MNYYMEQNMSKLFESFRKFINIEGLDAYGLIRDPYLHTNKLTLPVGPGRKRTKIHIAHRKVWDNKDIMKQIASYLLEPRYKLPDFLKGNIKQPERLWVEEDFMELMNLPVKSTSISNEGSLYNLYVQCKSERIRAFIKWRFQHLLEIGDKQMLSVYISSILSGRIQLYMYKAILAAGQQWDFLVKQLCMYGMCRINNDVAIDFVKKNIDMLEIKHLHFMTVNEHSGILDIFFDYIDRPDVAYNKNTKEKVISIMFASSCVPLLNYLMSNFGKCRQVIHNLNSNMIEEATKMIIDRDSDIDWEYFSRRTDPVAIDYMLANIHKVQFSSIIGNPSGKKVLDQMIEKKYVKDGDWKDAYYDLLRCRGFYGGDKKINVVEWGLLEHYPEHIVFDWHVRIASKNWLEENVEKLEIGHIDYLLDNSNATEILEKKFAQYIMNTRTKYPYHQNMLVIDKKKTKEMIATFTEILQEVFDGVEEYISTTKK